LIGIWTDQRPLGGGGKWSKRSASKQQLCTAAPAIRPSEIRARATLPSGVVCTVTCLREAPERSLRPRSRVHSRSCLAGAAGDAEVEHLHGAIRAHRDVVRLHVAVNEPGLVRGAKRATGAYHPPYARAPVRVGREDVLAEALTVHELHDQERRPLVLAHVVDGDGVRMVEGRGGAGLAEHSRNLLRPIFGLAREHRFKATLRASCVSWAR
jgi:hypothetical protein